MAEANISTGTTIDGGEIIINPVDPGLEIEVLSNANKIITIGEMKEISDDSAFANNKTDNKALIYNDIVDVLDLAVDLDYLDIERLLPYKAISAYKPFKIMVNSPTGCTITYTENPQTVTGSSYAKVQTLTTNSRPGVIYTANNREQSINDLEAGKKIISTNTNLKVYKDGFKPWNLSVNYKDRAQIINGSIVEHPFFTVNLEPATIQKKLSVTATVNVREYATSINGTTYFDSSTEVTDDEVSISVSALTTNNRCFSQSARGYSPIKLDVIENLEQTETFNSASGIIISAPTKYDINNATGGAGFIHNNKCVLSMKMPLKQQTYTVSFSGFQTDTFGRDITVIIAATPNVSDFTNNSQISFREDAIRFNKGTSPTSYTCTSNTSTMYVWACETSYDYNPNNFFVEAYPIYPGQNLIEKNVVKGKYYISILGDTNLTIDDLTWTGGVLSGSGTVSNTLAQNAIESTPRLFVLDSAAVGIDSKPRIRVSFSFKDNSFNTRYTIIPSTIEMAPGKTSIKIYSNSFAGGDEYDYINNTDYVSTRKFLSDMCREKFGEEEPRVDEFEEYMGPLYDDIAMTMMDDFWENYIGFDYLDFQEFMMYLEDVTGIPFDDGSVNDMYGAMEVSSCISTIDYILNH